MNTRQDDARAAKDTAIAEVLADGHVEIDLADPPTREELGLVGDADDAYLENKDLSSFRVTVTFSDGHVLSTDHVNVLGVRTAASGEVDRLLVGVHQLSLDDVAQRLETAVGDFGVDPGDVRSFLSSAESAPDLGRIVTATLPTTGIAAPETLEIEPTVNEDQQNNLINYRISFEPRAAS
ncbi:hypothetical protein [Nocardioides jishulii]|uniref:Uncharacterized protein n=1 Tax=Nocardioides jishulii TaxID=2575440 RepID=A0A4U2YRD9_9ACTN|nr:hypothetical protein [Nocardioides jishulii]QCX26175.1 hypothetical protein FCL41_00430 [Nocardioides jishulii]TKI64026.1 hypothetical protein FC770_02280 [Nocardioides jishulii]